MNWRQWLYLMLTTDTSLVALVPAPSIMAAGSLTGSPKDRPFIVIRVNEETPELSDDSMPVATSRNGEIWVYDEPGSYDKIDSIIAAVRDRLTGPISRVIPEDEDETIFSGGIAAVWAGDSRELADDVLSAITRNSSYRLVGSAA